MEPLLSEYIMNNDSEQPLIPTEIVHQVQTLLEVPVKELTEINDECFIFEEPLKELKERRERVERKIKVYHTILSPARRLPANTLYEIILHCLRVPVHRNSAMSAMDAPVLLTRISICGGLSYCLHLVSVHGCIFHWQLLAGEVFRNLISDISAPNARCQIFSVKIFLA